MLAGLLAEIEEDRKVLQEIADSVGSGTGLGKEIGSWIGAKASQAKVGRSNADGFGNFEAVEFLTLGVVGKKQLWRALRVLQPSMPGLESRDFDHLILRADAQYEALETHRLGMVREVFRVTAGGAGKAG